MFFKQYSIAAALSLLIAAPAAAAVVSGSITGGTVFTRAGNFIILANPSGGVGRNNFDDNNVRAFNELQNYTLTASLLLDVGGSVASGRSIDSHYLVFDPARNQTVEGSAVFGTRVLGIIFKTSSLIASDYLGRPGVTYLSPEARGLEPPVDSVSFTLNTVDFSLSGSNPGDSFRVITAATVPEPVTWAMLVTGFGLVGAGMRRSRRHAIVA